MKNSLHSNKRILSLGLLVGTLFTALFGIQTAFASITSQLEIGSKGADVTALQTFLAQDATLYPQGLVTGYFGFLTKSAVSNFQSRYGIDPVGRVGPITMAKLNELMASGGVSSGDAVPILTAPTSQPSSTSATVTWTTNEPTQGQLYFSTSAISADEATGPHQLPNVSGTQVTDGSSYQTTHTIMIQNLQPNTVYNYMVRAIDSSGNMSMVWPPSSFKTTQ